MDTRPITNEIKPEYRRWYVITDNYMGFLNDGTCYMDYYRRKWVIAVEIALVQGPNQPPETIKLHRFQSNPMDLEMMSQLLVEKFVDWCVQWCQHYPDQMKTLCDGAYYPTDVEYKPPSEGTWHERKFTKTPS